MRRPRRSRNRTLLMGCAAIIGLLMIVVFALRPAMGPGGRPLHPSTASHPTLPKASLEAEALPTPSVETVETQPPPTTTLDAVPSVFTSVKTRPPTEPSQVKVVTLEDLDPLHWLTDELTYDLSIVFALRPSEGLLPQMNAILPTIKRRRVEIILVLDNVTAQSDTLTAEIALCKAYAVALRLVETHVRPPLTRATYAQKLQMGLNASAAERVLFLTPHGVPVNTKTSFIDAMMDSATQANVVGCTSFTVGGIHHQARLLQAGYLGAIRVPQWHTTMTRIGFGELDFDNVLDEKKKPTAPSVLCLLGDREVLRQVGGFRTSELTLYDALAEPLGLNSTERRDWAHALDIEVTNTEYSMSRIEVRDLAFMTPEAKALLAEISVLLNRCEGLAKQLGHPLTHNIGVMTRQGLIRPLRDDVSLRVTDSVLRVRQVLSQVEALESRPRIPLDSLAWSLVIRAIAKDIALTVDISRATLEINLGAMTPTDVLLHNTEFQTETFTVPEFPTKVWKIFSKSTNSILGVPLQMVAVIPSGNQYGPVVDISASWLTEEPFVKQRMLSLETDCPAMAKQMMGALAAFEALPLSAQKARFCGLLYVGLNGGIYRDADVGPVAQLLSWFDPSRGFFCPVEKGSAVDLSFFAAPRGDQRVLLAIRAIIQTMAFVAVDDAALLTDTTFLANVATPALSQAYTAKSAAGLVLHHHGSVAWGAPYVGWPAERARLSRQSGVAPRRRIVFVGANEDRSTTLSEIADVKWRSSDAFMIRTTVTDANCTDVLDQAAFIGSSARYNQLVRALPVLPFKIRQFLCSAAAVYLTGGVALSWEAKPRHLTWQSWVPKAHLFFGTVRKAGTDDIDIGVFGATARSPCLLEILNLANENAAQWHPPMDDPAEVIRKVIRGVKSASSCSAADAPQMVSLEGALSGHRRPPRFVWNVNSTIPKQVWLINAAAELDPAAALTDKVWKREEPSVPRRVLDTSICRNLASNFPNFITVYDNFKLDIMRADTCRLLVLYFRGGVYMDLDVHWRVPLATWFNPEQSLVIGSAGTDTDSTTGGGGAIANWFIAAAPKHPCIYDALKAMAVEKPDAPQGVHVVDRTGVVGFSAAIRQCIHVHDIMPLSGRALTTDYVVHLPRNAGGWRYHLYSLTVAAVWPTRFVIPRIGDTLNPAEQDVMKQWIANEPEMRHVVATVKDCVVALSQTDPQVSWFIKNIRTLPSALRRLVCRVAIAQHWGAVYMDSDIEWTTPMVSWIPLSGTLLTLVRVRDKLTIEPGIIAAGRHDRCAQQILSTMELRVSTARGYADFANLDWQSFAVGESMLTSQSSQCSQVTPISSIVRRDVAVSPVSMIPFVRILLTRHDPLPPGVEQEADAQWTLEEPLMTRRIQSYSVCKDLAGKHRAIFEKLGIMPNHLQRVVCSLLLVYELGGYYVDERTRWEHPIADWLPSEETIVVPRDENGKVVPWFFGATKEHPCLERALYIFSHRIASVANFSSLTRSQQSYVAGYRAFRDGLKGCSPPSLVISADSAVRYVPAPVLVPSNPTAELIPRTVHLIWNTTALHSPAKEIHEDWLVQEPTFRRRIVTDDECRDLASMFPGLLPNYDAMPLNVMRADTCRVLAVYYYGGIYMDLDVEWVRPMNQWLDLSREIIIGNETEDGKHVCNWFFAAKARHPCIERVLEVITQRSDPAVFAKTCAQTQHFVHFTTGPAAFTAGVEQCAVPVLSAVDVAQVKIFHQYASTQWKDYPSWRDQRESIKSRCQKQQG